MNKCHDKIYRGDLEAIILGERSRVGKLGQRRFSVGDNTIKELGVLR